MLVSPSFIQVRVRRGIELATERINPVPRLSKKAIFITLIMAAHRAGIFRHVRSLEGLTIVKDGRIIATVKVGVGFDEEMVGKHPPAIAEQHAQRIGGLQPIPLPASKP